MEPPKPLDEVGVRGLSLTGDVGELGSFEPDESFVLFFFRKPRVGMEAHPEVCEMKVE